MTGIAAGGGRALPVVIAGAGPAGIATTIGLARAGEAVVTLEARGAMATRARNIFLRPQAREIFEELTGTKLGRDTTIMSIENELRAVAKAERTPVLYGHQVTHVDDLGDHVAVRFRDTATDETTTRNARVFIDASGGRLEATNVGDMQRIAQGPSHTYVTAQYDTPAPFDSVFGAYDRHLDEGMFFFPIEGKPGFVAYYDLAPGLTFPDETKLLARFDTLAGQLQLGTPVTPPQVFDAKPHLVGSATSGRILKLGDSAGNADPYIGAGLAAALVDAQSAVRALTKPGGLTENLREAAEHVRAGHDMLGDQGSLMVRARGLGLRFLPSAHFDQRLRPDDLGDSWMLDKLTQALTNQPI